jgi:hypothetical protein
MLRIIKSEPKKSNQIYNGPHHQLNYQSCWAPHLNNPLLNTLYKDSVCYTERWYLELRRLINEEIWYHPLLNVVIGDVDLRRALVKSAFIDGALMRSVLQGDAYPEFHISASVNLKKLNRWCAFFVSLPDSHETLVRLNAQSPD